MSRVRAEYITDDLLTDGPGPDVHSLQFEDSVLNMRASY